MVKPVKGDVVVTLFPFSDLSSSKRRPALVVATLTGDDIVLCQITSQAKRDRYAIRLQREDFNKGKLRVQSHIRPNRLFTADRNNVLYSAGRVKPEKLQEVTSEIIEILES